MGGGVGTEMQTSPLVWVVVIVAATVLPTVIVIGAIWGLRRVRLAQMVDPADGVLQVTGCNLPGDDSVYSTYRVNGVVSAPGLPPTPVEVRGIAPTSKWPMPGQQLPVRVDRASPSRLKIQWDQVGTGRQAAAERAEQLAAQLRAGSSGGPVAPGQWESASAVVTGSREVPASAAGPVPPGGVVELSLEVTRTNGASYPARTNAAFSTPRHRDQATAVGTQLPVRVDPTDPTRVTVDPAALGTTG